jgi:hypothetical protein
MSAIQPGFTIACAGYIRALRKGGAGLVTLLLNPKSEAEIE